MPEQHSPAEASGERGAPRQVVDLALHRYDHDAEFHARVQRITLTMLAEGYEPRHSLRRTVTIALYVHDQIEAPLTGRTEGSDE